MNALPALQIASPACDLKAGGYCAHDLQHTAQGLPPNQTPFADAGSKIPPACRLVADHVPSVIGGRSRVIPSGAAQHSCEIGALFGDCKLRSIRDCSPRLGCAVTIRVFQLKHHVLANGTIFRLQKGKHSTEYIGLPRAEDFALSIDGVEVSLDAASKAQFLNRDRISADRHATGHSMSRADRASAERDGTSSA